MDREEYWDNVARERERQEVERQEVERREEQARLADARALWAYRVVWHANQGFGLVPRYNDEADLQAAAAMHWPHLPADVRAKLGERP